MFFIDNVTNDNERTEIMATITIKTIFALIGLPLEMMSLRKGQLAPSITMPIRSNKENKTIKNM